MPEDAITEHALRRGEAMTGNETRRRCQGQLAAAKSASASLALIFT